MSFIYALLDPKTNQIRYIGKASNLEKRLKSHLRSSKKSTTPVYCWIRKLKKQNLIPKIESLYEVSELEWQNKEKELIAKYRSSHDLLNLAIGGNQPILKTPKDKRLWYLKQQLGIGLKDGVVSEETKEKLRQLAFRQPNKFGLWSQI